jgi:predicted nuclease of predicted toxin-antitoxin system
MRFLVDECTGPAVARWLGEQKHEVFSVYDEDRGARDDDLLEKAFEENWILVTNDKDFGEKIYRQKRRHRGIIFLRLDDERAGNKIATLKRLLEKHSAHLQDQFVVVTEKQIRFFRADKHLD